MESEVGLEQHGLHCRQRVQDKDDERLPVILVDDSQDSPGDSASENDTAPLLRHRAPARERQTAAGGGSGVGEATGGPGMSTNRVPECLGPGFVPI